MHAPDEDPDDVRMHHLLGNLLRWGVLLSAAVTLAGGVFLLAARGGSPVAYGAFRGEPGALTSVAGIVRGALALRSDAVVQLGVILLLATPIARVVFSLVAFLRQRDLPFVLMTLFVLAVLVFSLAFGGRA